MHQVIQPDDRLQSTIHSINVFTLDDEVPTQVRLSNKMFPDGFPDVWIVSGDIYHSLDGIHFEVLPDVFIWGLYDRPSYLRIKGSVSVVSAKFYPWSVKAFLPHLCPLRKNSYCALSIDGKQGNELKQMIGEPKKDAEKLQEWLAIILGQNGTYSSLVKQVYEALVGSRGANKVDAIARKVGHSRQHVNRAFKEETGMGVKEYAVIYRMRLCIDHFIEQKEPSLTSLAHAFEFFDQSHFIRSFKQVTGETPRGFFARNHLLKQHL